MIDLTTPQRQSPWAIVFLGLRILRSIGIAQLAIVLLFVAQAPLSGPLIALPFVAILVLGALSALAWWRYTFMLIDDELVVTKGVLRIDRLTVPVDRIQSMGIDQRLLHRLTGLVTLSVDTAGSAEAEFSIDAIARPVAEELQRQAVITTRQAPVAVAPDGVAVTEDTEILVHGPGRLLTAALTSWPLSGLIVLGPLLAFGEDFLDRLPGFVPEIDRTELAWWWIPVGIAGFVAFSVVLNIVRIFLQDWNLTLRASASSLRRTAGLFSRTSKASSVARIQVVSSVANPLQHRAGIRSVDLSTIGEGDLSLIGCDARQWEEIVRRAQPGVEAAPVLDRRISSATTLLVARNALIAAAVVAVSAWFVVGWWSLLALLVALPSWIIERIRVRNFRWSTGAVIATSSRVVNRSTQRTLPRKTNAIAVTESLFERRRGLGTVEITTAAGRVAIGAIPVAEARAVRDLILHQLETDSRPWM